MILFYINLCYIEVSDKGSGRANRGSEFVVANRSQMEKLEPNEFKNFDFSQGFSKKSIKKLLSIQIWHISKE